MELTIVLDDSTKRAELFGPGNQHLRLIRGALGVDISARDSTLRLAGESQAVSKAAAVIERLQDVLQYQEFLRDEDLDSALATATREAEKGNGDSLAVYSQQTTIVPKTTGQGEYLAAMKENDLVFCLGPAGTGKTYLAVAQAVSLLKKGTIKRIVLVRPAVEAGEKLGYLPGDLQAKVNPYLRPLFDAMNDMMNYDQIKRFMQNDVIEVVPLAFMRGRTLNNAVVILDEAQNTTVSQMLMFLTRMGQGTKMIVTGDDSQVDLEGDRTSGLVDAIERLEGIGGVAVVHLKDHDIVRHRLVQDVVKAYSRNGRSNGGVEPAGD